MMFSKYGTTRLTVFNNDSPNGNSSLFIFLYWANFAGFLVSSSLRRGGLTSYDLLQINTCSLPKFSAVSFLPVSDKSTSVQPVNLFSKFHSLKL